MTDIDDLIAPVSGFLEDVNQAALEQSDAGAANPTYGVFFPMEGTIIRVHYPRDRSNKSKRHVEYDIAMLMADTGVLSNVPLAIGVHGIVEAEEIILHPASVFFPKGTDFSTEAVGGSMDSDGDRVLVQFINGSPFNPVITHVLHHSHWDRQDNGVPTKYKDKLAGLSWKTGESYGQSVDEAFGTGDPGFSQPDLLTTPDNRHRLGRMNGTYWAVDADGNLFIDFSAHPNDDKGLEAGKVKKKLVIQNEGMDLVRIEKTADAEIAVVLGEQYTDAEGSHTKVTFKFGDLFEIVRDGTNWTAKFGETFAANLLAQFGDGAVKVAIADHLQTLWGDLVTYLDGHTHAYEDADTADTEPGGSPSIDTTRETEPPTQSATTYDTSINSSKVKIPDN